MSGQEKTDAIMLSVKLRSGGFESSIEVPVDASKSEMDEFVSSWLKMMEMGLKLAKGKP